MHTKMYDLLHRLQTGFFRVALWFELLISAIIIVGIGVHLFRLPQVYAEGISFNKFLQYLLDALVGLEVIMMLCRHDLDSIIEVMIFAVTKALISNHESEAGILFGIVGVAILFAIRKFLFLSASDIAERRKHADYIQREK